MALWEERIAAATLEQDGEDPLADDSDPEEEPRTDDGPEPEAALAAILADFKVAEAPVIMRERQGGVSSIHSFKSVYYMIKVSLALIIDRLSIRKSKGGRA